MQITSSNRLSTRVREMMKHVDAAWFPIGIQSRDLDATQRKFQYCNSKNGEFLMK